MTWLWVGGGAIAAVLFVVAYEALLRWRLRRSLDTELKKIKAPGYRKKPSEIQLAVSEDGITAKRSQEKFAEVRWKDVARITAYKRDLFAYDCICVAFDCAGGKFIEIDETMDGFIEVMERASLACVGCVSLADWYREIMLPPFEENMRVLFDKHGVKTK